MCQAFVVAKYKFLLSHKNFTSGIPAIDSSPCKIGRNRINAKFNK
jgi:hypothetical protein